MYTLIYFSPTGNVLHLTKLLADHFEPGLTKIFPLEFTTLDMLEKNKHLVLLYPVHSFNVPRIVRQFVKKMPSGLYDSVSLIGVGCVTTWVNGAVSLGLRKIMIKKNYPIIHDEILAMPLTFILAFADDTAYKVIDESEKKIKGISTAIIEGRPSVKEIKWKSRFLNLIGKIEIFASRLFGLELHASKDCNSCGTCWVNCPSKNIRSNSKGIPGFGFNCLMCMRCIYNCPQKAISPRFSKFIPIRSGYSIKKYRI